MAKKSKEVKQWITIKGNHIPVYEGQTVDEAAKGFMKHEKSSPAKAKAPMSKKERSEKVQQKRLEEIEERFAKDSVKEKRDSAEKSSKTYLADDMGSKDLYDAPIGSKISFEGESWEKIGDDEWQNTNHKDEVWGGKDVYRQRIEGEEDMEVEMTLPKKEDSEKYYSVKQEIMFFGKPQATRLENIKASSEEEAISKYKEMYPKAQDDLLRIQRINKDATRFQHENGEWEEPHPPKSTSETDKQQKNKTKKVTAMEKDAAEWHNELDKWDKKVEEYRKRGMSEAEIEKQLDKDIEAVRKRNKTKEVTDAIKAKTSSRKTANNEFAASAKELNRSIHDTIKSGKFKTADEAEDYYVDYLSRMPISKRNEIAKLTGIGGSGAYRIMAMASNFTNELPHQDKSWDEIHKRTQRHKEIIEKNLKKQKKS